MNRSQSVMHTAYLIVGLCGLALLAITDGAGFRCDFEEASCDIYKENDGTSWTENRGTIFKGSKVGPRFDHTTGKSSGRYSYVAIPEDGATHTARFVSPVQYLDEPLCVAFWYQAGTAADSTISVYKRFGHNEEVRVLQIAGNSAPGHWKRSAVTVMHSGEVAIIIEGKIQAKSMYGTYGNVIAIDDISATSGVCQYESASPAPATVRLTGGPSGTEGRVEVNHDGAWKPICNDGWGVEESTTICNQLGFNGGRINNLPAYDSGYDARDGYWISDLNCPLGAQSLDMCNHRGWGEHECAPNQYATLKCNVDESNDAWRRVKIVDHEVVNSRVRGRVLILHRRTWGGICDRGWDDNAATAVCRTLGFMGEARALHPSSGAYAAGSEPSWIDNVQCDQSDRDFLECRQINFNEGSCTPVGVECGFLSTPFPFSCDFERGDGCGIITETGGDSSWEVTEARAVSGAMDATNQDPYGNIMTASSTANGDVVAVTATFISAVEQVQCLRFKYMYTDSDSAPLTVYRKYRRSRQLVWERQQYNGNTLEWQSANAEIPSSEFSLVFSVSSDSGRYRGSISLDDIRVTPGQCSEDSREDVASTSQEQPDQSSEEQTLRPIYAGTPGRSLFAYNFDDPSMFQVDSFYPWVFTSRATPSRGTGPDGDHTQSGTSQGMYAHIEATSATDGSVAQMCVSRVTSDTGERCLQLWRNMYGPFNEMGTLTISTVESCSGTSTTVGDQPTPTIVYNGQNRLAEFTNADRSDEWKQIMITISSSTGGANFLIEATKGDGYRSDISIDDLEVTDGRCTCNPSSYSCGFEDDEQCCYIETTNQMSTVPLSIRWASTIGNTPQGHTGPTTGRTGSPSDQFMFTRFEQNGRDIVMRSGDCADLRTVELPLLTGRATYTMTFWAYMRGSGIGSLQVLLSRADDPTFQMHPLGSYSGELDKYTTLNEYGWGQLTITYIQSGYVMTFRGCAPTFASNPQDTTTTADIDYIAIDDIDFTVQLLE